MAARGLWLAAAATSVAALGFVIAVEPTSTVTAAFLLLASMSYASVGALIASRYRDNPLGWLFLLVGVCFGVTSVASHYVGVDGPPRAFAGPAGYVGIILPALVLPFALPTYLVLFPSGSLLSRRWRLVVALGAAAAIVLSLGLLVSPSTDHLVDTPAWVAAIPFIDAFVVVGVVLTTLATVAGFVNLLLRYRRAGSDERQHVKWLTTVLAAMVIASALGFVASITGPDILWLLASVTILIDGFGVLIGIPAATAIAVLTFGLYDVGIVVKKTFVYGALVATFGILSALVLFFFSPLALGGVEAGSSVARVVSGLLIAGLVFAATVGRLKRLARRAVYGRRATPYEVVADFTERLGDAYSTDDVLPRTAEILRASTGADVARVWLMIGDELRPAASAPGGALSVPARAASSAGDVPDLPGHTFPVRHQGELLGAFTVEMSRAEPLSATSERLAADLATHAGLVLRNVRLTEELRGTIDELRASRQRIVTAQDDRARKLERDLHDGAQQHLVALAVKLGLAARLSDGNEKVQALLAEIRNDADDALQNLRDLARGIYPPVLADHGLAHAIEGHAHKVPFEVALETDGVSRYAQEIEAAVYFCCLEALQNAAKYANATRAIIRLAEHDGAIEFSIADDGVGFDPAAARAGAGLTNMRDRVEALGGTLEITSSPNAGTTLAGRIPAVRLGETTE